MELYLDADYQTKDIGFHLKTHSTYYNDSDASFDLLESYGNVNLSLSSFIQAGKRMYSWGNGYAFNPVGYVNPFKDPENPELAQAGLLSVGFEKIKSLNSDSLKTIALTAIVIPPEEISPGSKAGKGRCRWRNDSGGSQTNIPGRSLSTKVETRHVQIHVETSAQRYRILHGR